MHQLTITRQGVQAAVLFVLRVGACVSLRRAVDLDHTLGVPPEGIQHDPGADDVYQILEMTYRYIYVLLHSASDMFEARLSRTVGRTGTRAQQQFVGNAMGSLW